MRSAEFRTKPRPNLFLILIICIIAVHPKHIFTDDKVVKNGLKHVILFSKGR
jgi:hypothetical protein